MVKNLLSPLSRCQPCGTPGLARTHASSTVTQPPTHPGLPTAMLLPCAGSAGWQAGTPIARPYLPSTPHRRTTNRRPTSGGDVACILHGHTPTGASPTSPQPCSSRVLAGWHVQLGRVARTAHRETLPSTPHRRTTNRRPASQPALGEKSLHASSMC